MKSDRYGKPSGQHIVESDYIVNGIPITMYQTCTIDLLKIIHLLITIINMKIFSGIEHNG